MQRPAGTRGWARAEGCDSSERPRGLARARGARPASTRARPALSPSAAIARASMPRPGTNTGTSSSRQTMGPPRSAGATPRAWYCSLRLRAGRRGPPGNGRRERARAERDALQPRRRSRRDRRSRRETNRPTGRPRACPDGSGRRPAARGRRAKTRPTCAAVGRGSCATRRRQPASDDIHRRSPRASGARPGSPARDASSSRRSHAMSACRCRGADRRRQRSRSRPPSPAIVARSFAATSSRTADACATRSAALASAASASPNRGDERRPRVQPKAVAREAIVVVAVVVDPAQPMSSCIRLDRFARLCQPRPRPHDAVAPDDLRHRRERGDAAAAQCLQQKSFRLIATVVRQEHQTDPALERHFSERPVARAARPCLDAFACARAAFQPTPGELDGNAAASPASTERLAMHQPRIGLRAEAMVDVQRDDARRRGSWLRARSHGGARSNRVRR